MIFKTALFCILALGFMGCAHKPSTYKNWTLKKEWIRSGEMVENLQGRVVHRFTPIPYKETIIVGHARDGITAFDEHTAKIRWRLAVKEGVEPGASLVNDTLYFGASDGQFYAVNPNDGQIIWTYPLRAEGLGRPVIQGDTVYVLGGNSVLHALEASTGKMKWVYSRRDASMLSIRGASRPLIRGDSLYIGFSDGSFIALNKTTGSLIWEAILNKQRRFKDVDSAPVTDGEKLYLSGYDDAFYAVDKTGKLQWRLDEGGYDEALFDDGIIYYSTTTGKVLAIKTATGKVLWTFQGKGFMTGPQLLRGQLLIVGEWNGRLLAINKKNGELISSFEPGRGVTSVPLIRENKIYFMSHEGNLFCVSLQSSRSKNGVL